MTDLLPDTLAHAFRRNRFLVLGRAGLDLYADPPGTALEQVTGFSAALGGSAGNIAAGIARLDGDVALLSAVSDDAVGRFTLNQLKHYGIAAQHMQVVQGEVRTSLAVVETRAEHCQSVIYRNNAADFQLTEAHVRSLTFADWGVLIVTGTALALDPSRGACVLAMTMARDAGAAVVIDLDYRPYSWASAAEAARVLGDAADRADMIIGNDVEFDVLSPGHGLDAARALARHQGGRPVVYKMGEKGSISFVGDMRFETPIFRVEALKPTGAGDAFLSALVTGLARGQPFAEAVARGSASAAIVVARVACAPAMPTADELNTFLQSQSIR